VNLIFFNPYEGSDYQRPTRADMVAFQEYLIKHGVLCTIRDSKGLDISAACGQLKEKELRGDNMTAMDWFQVGFLVIVVGVGLGRLYLGRS
jgi:predicted nucleic acid-binding Zn ribbon protein